MIPTNANVIMLTSVVAIVSLVTTVILIGRKAGIFEHELRAMREDMTSHVQLMRDEIGTMHERAQTSQNEIIKLGVSLFGVDGSNGLRSEIRRLAALDTELKHNIQMLDGAVQLLRSRLDALEQQRYKHMD